MKWILLIAATALALSAPAVPRAHAANGLHCSYKDTEYDTTDQANWKKRSLSLDGPTEKVFEFLPGDMVSSRQTVFNGKPDHANPWMLRAQVTNDQYVFNGEQEIGGGTITYTIDRQTGALTGFLDNPLGHYVFSFEGTCEAITLPAPKL